MKSYKLKRAASINGKMSRVVEVVGCTLRTCLIEKGVGVIPAFGQRGGGWVQF